LCAVNELAERTQRADDALPEGSSARDRVRTYLDFITERSPGWVTYQALAGHDPGEEAARVRRQARKAAVAALAEVVGDSRGHRDDFTLWGYLGFLDDACLRWVHADCPGIQRHSLIDATLVGMKGALGDWTTRNNSNLYHSLKLEPPPNLFSTRSRACVEPCITELSISLTVASATSSSSAPLTLSDHELVFCTYSFRLSFICT